MGRHGRYAAPARPAPARHVRARVRENVPPHHRRSVAPAVALPLAAGVVLVASGALVLASMGFYEHRASSTAATLLRAPSAAATATVLRADDVRQCSAPPPSDAAAGTMRAVLAVPALSLMAPVLAGTGDAQLDVGVGHLDASAWPDQAGAVVLEAHDVTFFAHLADLRPGDALTVTAPCRHWTYRVVAASVVAAGTPVPAGTAPRLVLVTCWPSDALFVTNERYVVTADLASAGVAAQALDAVPDLPHVQAAHVPGLAAGQLAAASVGIQLGRLHLDAGFDRVWAQSARAFEASRACTQLVVQATRALRGGQGWAVIAPGVPLPRDAGGVVWSGPVQVSVHGSGSQVTGATVTGAVTSGPPGQRRTRDVTVTTAVSAGTMTITAWQEQPVGA